MPSAKDTSGIVDREDRFTPFPLPLPAPGHSCGLLRAALSKSSRLYGQVLMALPKSLSMWSCSIQVLMAVSKSAWLYPSGHALSKSSWLYPSPHGSIIQVVMLYPSHGSIKVYISKSLCSIQVLMALAKSLSKSLCRGSIKVSVQVVMLYPSPHFSIQVPTGFCCGRTMQ